MKNVYVLLTFGQSPGLFSPCDFKDCWLFATLEEAKAFGSLAWEPQEPDPEHHGGAIFYHQTGAIRHEIRHIEFVGSGVHFRPDQSRSPEGGAGDIQGKHHGNQGGRVIPV
jgi:hypothetical protein